MDRTDKKILAALQGNGRLTITELADHVNLSISPCHRRLKALEASGAIRGYRAQLDADKLGLGFEALIFVTMQASHRDILTAFEDQVAAIPQVLQAQRLFGEPDFLLRVIAVDQAAYLRLYDEQLITLPGVSKMTSTLIMKNVVEHRALPI